MPTGLAFVERAEQLERVPDGFEPIALSPLVDIEGSLRRPESWVRQEELERRGEGNFDRARSLAARLDELLGDPETGIRPGRWDAFWLKVVYDALTLKAHVASTILGAESPAAVAVFAQRREPPPGVAISEYDSTYADALECVAPAAGVELRRLPYGPVPRRERLLFRTAQSGVAAARAAKHAFTWSRHRSGSGAGRVLCLDFSYSTPAIATELGQRGFEIWVWPAGGRLHRLGGSVLGSPARVLPLAPTPAWRDDRELARLFDVDGVSIWPSARRYLERVVRHHVSSALRAHSAAGTVLETLRPRVVLTSVASYARERAICDAARKAGVPSVVSRHGEFGMRDVPIVALEDADVVDRALCWGEWEARLTRRYAGGRVATEVVGSPMIEAAAAAAPARETVRARLSIGSGERVVLYVPTGLSGNRWYASNRSPIDTLYFTHQVQVARALLALEGWRVVIKEHPGIRESPIEEWCGRFAPQGPLVVGKDFAALIHLADAVLLDFPSTTMALALRGSAAVYVVDHPVAKWEPGVREHLVAHGVGFLELGNITARLHADDPRGPRTYPRAASEPLLADGAGTAAARAAGTIAAAVTG